MLFQPILLHMQITCCRRNTVAGEKNQTGLIKHNKKMTMEQTQREKWKEEGSVYACVHVCVQSLDE